MKRLGLVTALALAGALALPGCGDKSDVSRSSNAGTYQGAGRSASAKEDNEPVRTPPKPHEVFYGNYRVTDTAGSNDFDMETGKLKPDRNHDVSDSMKEYYEQMGLYWQVHVDNDSVEVYDGILKRQRVKVDTVPMGLEDGVLTLRIKDGIVHERSVRDSSGGLIWDRIKIRKVGNHYQMGFYVSSPGDNHSFLEMVKE